MPSAAHLSVWIGGFSGGGGSGGLWAKPVGGVGQFHSASPLLVQPMLEIRDRRLRGPRPPTVGGRRGRGGRPQQLIVLVVLRHRKGVSAGWGGEASEAATDTDV